MSKQLLIFGHGYTARAFTSVLPAAWRVTGTTRDAENLDVIRATGANPLLWPGENPSGAISKADAILISAGPTARGCPVLAEFHDEIAARAPQLKWAGYLSTTGVYGDHQGGWVDEETPLTPATRRGHWRVQAEQAWQALAADSGLPLHIFRLAGIYGPGRGPFAKIRVGTARRIVKPGQVFSRTHVEDIAQVLLASLNAPNPGRIYNVCDDDPAPPQDVLAEAATLLNLPLPPVEDFKTTEMTPMARSFYSESKRVSNARIKEELGVTLKYPDYKTGLRAMLEQEE